MKSLKYYIYILNKVHVKYNHGAPLSDVYIGEVQKLLQGEPVCADIMREIFNWWETTTVDEFVSDNEYEFKVVYSILSKTDLYKDVKTELLRHLKAHQENYEKRRLNKKIKYHVDFDQQTILENCNRLPPDEKVIYALLTLFPTRRAVDYRKMLVVQDAVNYDPLFNYYVISEKKFVFNVTKNNEFQEFTVPEALHDIIVNNISESQHILGKRYTQSQLSLKIQAVLKKIYGLKMCATELRRLYATKLTTEQYNYAERKRVAHQMNHSVMENYKYSY